MQVKEKKEKKKKKKKIVFKYPLLFKATRFNLHSRLNFSFFQMTTVQEDLKTFFKSNIATDEDLNLKHVQSLLAARRDEQSTLNTKVYSYETCIR